MGLDSSEIASLLSGKQAEQRCKRRPGCLTADPSRERIDAREPEENRAGSNMAIMIAEGASMNVHRFVIPNQAYVPTNICKAGISPHRVLG